MPGCRDAWLWSAFPSSRMEDLGHSGCPRPSGQSSPLGPEPWGFSSLGAEGGLEGLVLILFGLGCYFCLVGLGWFVCLFSCEERGCVYGFCLVGWLVWVFLCSIWLVGFGFCFFLKRTGFQHRNRILPKTFFKKLYVSKFSYFWHFPGCPSSLLFKRNITAIHAGYLANSVFNPIKEGQERDIAVVNSMLVLGLDWNSGETEATVLWIPAEKRNNRLCDIWKKSRSSILSSIWWATWVWNSKTHWKNILLIQYTC